MFADLPLRDVLTTPVFGGLVPWRGLLAVLLFYGGILLARRARRYYDRKTEGTVGDHERVRRWVHRTTLVVCTLVAFSVAGLPVGVFFGRRITTLGSVELTPATLLTAAVIVVVSRWFSRRVQTPREGSVARREVEEQGTLDAIKRLVHYVVMAVGLGVALQTAGIHLGALFAAGAVFAVGVGFALQDIAQNFVSGIILLVERSITTQDVLELEGRVVRVELIGLRSTQVRSLDDEQLIVPNGTLVQNTVKNFTLTDPVIRVRGTVGVHYTSDMEVVAAALDRAGRDVPGRDPAVDPVVFLDELGANAVIWEVSVWSRDPWNVPRTRSNLNRAIWRRLQEAGVTIAYPQLDVHIQQSVP